MKLRRAASKGEDEYYDGVRRRIAHVFLMGAVDVVGCLLRNSVRPRASDIGTLGFIIERRR